MQTIAKATSVPMFTSSSRSVNGKMAAKTVTIPPVTSVVRSGVRKRGSTFATPGGSIRSRAIT